MTSYFKKILFLISALFFFQPNASEGQFVLNGSATTTSSSCSMTTYELTANVGGEGGQIWYGTLYNLTFPLDIQFQMFLGNKAYSVGADGIGFVLQPLSSSAGSTGGGMGFGGISPSVDVEFDTYKNGWDPAYCHVAIEKNGDVDHTVAADLLAGPVQLSPTAASLPDGTWHTARIMWDPSAKTLKVYFDCSLRVSYTGDIVTNIFGGNPNVYWGFTAGTGGAENLQEVCLTHTFLQNLRDTAICAGASVNMTASGGATYSWTPATGLNTNTGATVIATPAVTTKYYVTITDACGISIQDSSTIRVSNTVLTPTSTPSTCGNSNGTTSVVATGGISPYTYAWSSGQITTTATNLAAGTYTINTIDSLGCKATATDVVAGTPPLRDSIVSFTNVSVACGSNGTALDGVKGGSGPYTYSWNTAPVQTVANATNLAAGSYTCTVTDANSCTATATVTIAQPGALTASISATTNVSCNGGANGTATGGVIGGSAPYTYSWNSAPVQTTVTATGLPAGSYTFSVTDANGCTVTAVAVITQPSAIRDSIASITAALCNGQSNGSALDGVKDGTSPYTYAWSNAQTTPTATALAAGSYTVVVTDANGCKDSVVAAVTQPAPLTITAAAFAATCNGICNGSATIIPAGGTGPYTYAWSNAQTGATANNLCAANYSVVVTDANGCVHDTNPLTVTQPPAIVLTKTSTSAFCNQADGSASVTITGGTAPYLYQWSTGAVTTNITNVIPGPYCFGVEDANKCLDSICVIVPNTPGETASVTSTTNVTCNGGTDGTAVGNAVGGTSPYTYAWTGGQTTPTATALAAGPYTLTVTDSTGCQSTAVTTITQPALVVATPLATPATICIGQSSTISATAVGGTAPYTYSWNTGCSTSSCVVSPTTTTTYTVTTTDVNNCPGAPVPVTVTVDPPLSVTVGAPVSICPGASATVTATASGGNGTYSYNWNTGCTTSSCVVTPGATTYYTVTVSDGCTVPDVSDSMEVIIYPLPVIAFTADTTNGCYPVCVTFTDNSTIASGSLMSWNWNFGDGNVSAAKNPTDCYTNPGSYNVSVTITSNNGCPSSFTQNNMITVYDHPHTLFTASPQPTTIVSPNITFTDNTTDLYGLQQWLWNFGDTASALNFATTQNTSHQYSDTGRYCITLIDMNIHGCIDSITECIVIDPLFTFYIPNAFSPNGDGLNDVFVPKGTYFTTFEMYIFDRWGSIIYRTTDINKGWNGGYNNNSNLCQQDTYVYLINITDYKGVAHSYMGKVSLVK